MIGRRRKRRGISTKKNAEKDRGGRRERGGNKRSEAEAKRRSCSCSAVVVVMIKRGGGLFGWKEVAHDNTVCTVLYRIVGRLAGRQAQEGSNRLGACVMLGDGKTNNNMMRP